MSGSGPVKHVLTCSGLSKSYAGVAALKDVAFDVRRGEVHSLVGENGAGKSTLIKIVSGVVTKDSGDMWLLGEQFSPNNVRDAEALGIVTVHQESTAFLDLDVTDNIFVGREFRKLGGLMIDRPSMCRRAAELMEELGERVPLDQPVRVLSLAQRQMVAVARALSLEARLLILDEPTASLSAKEVEVLHRIVRRLRDSGVGVLFVSHLLEEVLELSDRVTVLRDGQRVETGATPDWTRRSLIKAMVGREIETTGHQGHACGASVVIVSGATSPQKFEDVSFEVRAGEIVGLGGLVGSGRTEVARAVFGLDPITSGSVTLGSVSMGGGVQGAVSAGVALVPEDRQHQGLVLEQSVAENLVMVVRSRLAKRGWIARRAEKAVVESQVSSLGVKAGSARTLVGSLSGGNQQKVVIGKWLASEPRLLILDEPTRGVDVGSKAEIHGLVRRLAAQGAAVLVVSSDLPELLELSDRILVMRSGRLVGELVGDDRSQGRVLELAFGTDGEA